MSEKLTQDIQEIVDSIFKQKEEVAMRKETEDALNKSANKINELVASLEAKDSELSEMVAKAEELESKITELSTKTSELESGLEKEKSDFEATKEELVKRAETAEEEIENIKKDQLAKARFGELTEAGVAAADEKAIEDQISKIRDMEEEMFESYKAERVELRTSIVAELEASTTEETAVETETTSEEEVSEKTEETSEEDDETAAVESEDAIEPMKAVAAALNLETLPSNDVISKYRDLGKEMAKKFERKSE